MPYVCCSAGLPPGGGGLTSVSAQDLDTSCIDVTVTGDGTAGNPLTISAVPIISPDAGNALECRANGLFSTDTGLTTISAQDQDSNSINVTLSGDGSPGNPLTVSADLILSPDPNNGLIVTPTGIFVDRTGGGFVEIDALGLDTSCIDITVTGDGTTANPLTISADLILDPNPDNGLVCGPTGFFQDSTGGGNVEIDALGLDTSCIDVTVTGDGSTANPLTISADPIISPDSGNMIECRANGLFTTFTVAPVPPGGQTPNGSCVQSILIGDGTPGNPLGVISDPVIDPDPCNTVSCGPSGLLVPSTEVVGADTSCIDITVVETPGCPTVFTVSADPIISPDAGNALECRINGLFSPTPAGGGLTSVSAQALDTSCVDVTVTGDGTVGNPLIVSAALILDPNPDNGLICSPTGFFQDITGGGNVEIVAQGLDTTCINTTVTGDGSTTNPLVISSDPIIDPNICNALTCGPAGLLVPNVELFGIIEATCPPTSTERSVDIDVTETPGCPEVWVIGARLSPCFGETNVLVNFDLLPTFGFQDIGVSVTLPEAGTYELDSQILGITRVAHVSGTSGAAIVARFFNVTAGAAVPNSEITVMNNVFEGTLTHTEVHEASVSQSNFITVTGPTTIRIEALQTTSSSGAQNVIERAEIIGGAFARRTALRFKKIAD